MKNIKSICLLLAATAVFFSCSDDSNAPDERQEKGKTLEDLNAEYGGANSIEYFEIQDGTTSNKSNSNKPSGKQHNELNGKKTTDNLKSTSHGLTYYSSRSSFESSNGCGGYYVEGFENSDDLNARNWVDINGPLDESTDNDTFNPEDILPGIQFLTEGSGLLLPYFRDYANYSMALGTYWATDNLEIHITKNDVREIGFDVFLDHINTLQGLVDIEFYGENGLIGTRRIYVQSRHAAFIGVKTSQALTKVRILAPQYVHSRYVWEAIDNVTFGPKDADCDGVELFEDNHPYSIMTAGLSFNGFNFNFENRYAGKGSFMADMINDVIIDIEKSSDDRTRDRTKLRNFERGVHTLAGEWYVAHLITREERIYLVEMASKAIEIFN